MKFSDFFSFRLKLINSLYSKKALVQDCAILFFVAIIPFWNMGIEGLWQIHDQGFSLYPTERLFDKFYLWIPFVNNGTGGMLLVSLQQLWPSDIFRSILSELGVELSLIQRLQLVSATAIAGWGAYYFVRTLYGWNEESRTRIAGLIAGTFYILNPFILYWIFLGAYPLYSISVLPFIAALLYNVLKEHDKKLFSGRLIAIVFLSTILLTTHPEITLHLVAFLAGFTVFMITTQSRWKSKTILIKQSKTVLTILGLSILVNAWWAVPTFYVVADSQLVNDAVSNPENLGKLHRLSYETRGIIDRFRLQIFPYNANYQDTPMYHWITSHYSTLLGIGIFSLAVGSVLVRSSKKIIWFFVLATSLYVGFSMGIAGPFSIIYSSAWDMVPFFRILDDPTKFLFVPMFTIAVLLGLFTGEIYRKLTNLSYKKISAHNKPINFIPKIYVGVMVLLILFNSYPLLSGNLYGVLQPLQVPSYYFKAREFLNSSQGNFNILIIPYNRPGYSALYEWAPSNVFGGYQGYGISFTAPFMMRTFTMPQITNHEIYSYIIDEETNHVGNILNLFNIKYVIVSNDLLDPQSHERIDTSRLETSLEDKEDIEFVKSIGKLDIYENKFYQESLIYGTRNYFISSSDQAINLFSRLDHSSRIIFLEENKDILDKDYSLNKLEGFKGTIEWNRIIRTNSLERWSATNQLSLNVVDRVQSEGSLTLGRIGEQVDLWYVSENVLKLSSRDYIRFWLKSDKIPSGGLFMLWDEDEKRVVLDFEYHNPSEWQEVMLNLGSGHMDYGYADLSKIRKINMQVFYEEAPTTLQIDGFLLGKFIPHITESIDYSESVGVSYQIINPTQYLIRTNCSTPCITVLSQAYDPGWQLQDSASQHLFDHFMANGYANAWYIEKAGELNLILKYKYQDLVYQGIIISVVTTLLILVLPFRGRVIAAIRKSLRNAKCS